MYEAVNGLAPKDILTPYVPGRSLRSVNAALWVVLRSQRVHKRASEVYAPRL